MTNYNNIEMQQHESIFSIFPDFLKRENFKNIIEIGTRFGAFTRFLKDTVPQSNVYTYNIRDEMQADKSGIEIRIKNIFDAGYNNIIDEEALNIFRSKNKNLILCDGGNKVREFNCLAKYVKTGDFIMAHDYSPSREYYYEKIHGRVWGACEIIEADISTMSETYGLIHYNQEEFQKVVWVCKTKY